MKILAHSSLLVAITFLTYFWTTNQTLSHYSLQAIAVLVVCYLLLKKIIPNTSENTLNLQAVLFLTTISLMLVFSTGGAVSPLFFILYFLLFCLSILFEPIQTTVLSFAILIPLITGIDRTQTTIPASVWGNLATLILITPMATIFGKKILDLQAKSAAVENLESKIVIEETTTTSWITGQLNPTLLETTNLLVGLISDKNLPTRHSSPLTNAYTKLKSLLETSKKIEESLKGN